MEAVCARSAKRGSGSLRKSTAPSLFACSCLTAPTTIPLLRWQFQRRSLAVVQAAICGRTALMTYRDRWLAFLVRRGFMRWRTVRLGDRVSRNVNAPPPPCKRAGTPPLPAHSLRLVRGRYRTLGSVAGIVPFLFLSASCLGSSVVRFAIHGCASSLLSTPGLRSVTPVRSPFLVPRHSAFPTFGRYDPATRDVANFNGWQRLLVI